MSVPLLVCDLSLAGPLFDDDTHTQQQSSGSALHCGRRAAACCSWCSVGVDVGVPTTGIVVAAAFCGQDISLAHAVAGGAHG